MVFAQSVRAGPSLKLMDLSLDGLFSASAEDGGGSLPRGGHDPDASGFRVQNVELTALGAVDPFFSAQAHIVHTIEDGESLTELEEAYLTTTRLPAGLELMAGMFFTRFGRMNAQHPHTWDFADQPIILNRLFGPDGLRNPGARLSWLPPTPFYLELSGSLQNADGPTAVSFWGQSGGRDPAHFRDLLRAGRLGVAFDLGPRVTVVPGISAAAGPNENAPDGQTLVLGGDLKAKWQPAATIRGWPFVSLTAEWLKKETRPSSAPVSGSYTELAWGFKPGWVMAFRWDGDPGANPSDSLEDKRTRYAGDLTLYPSEFSKVRLQGETDIAQSQENRKIHKVFLQAEFMIGSHGAHAF